jgi:hypothetical protein
MVSLEGLDFVEKSDYPLTILGCGLFSGACAESAICGESTIREKLRSYRDCVRVWVIRKLKEKARTPFDVGPICGLYCQALSSSGSPQGLSPHASFSAAAMAASSVG